LTGTINIAFTKFTNQFSKLNDKQIFKNSKYKSYDPNLLINEQSYPRDNRLIFF